MIRPSYELTQRNRPCEPSQISLPAAATFQVVELRHQSGDLMYSSRFRILLILTVAWIPAAVAAANPSEPSRSKSRPANAAHADPCWTSSAGKAMPSVAPWRAQINRRTAIYVIQHVQKACRIIADNSGKDSQLEALAPRLTPIFNDLRTKILKPIYRSHPDLERASLSDLRQQNVDSTALNAKPLESRVFRATRYDIRRATAIRLSEELSQTQQQVFKAGAEHLDMAERKEAAEKMLQPFIDGAAELSFASKVAYDAYPDLFAKKFEAVPKEPRTQESDATFRKAAPPLGSVKLSYSALAFVKSFMRQVRRNVPRDDQIASIGWARDQRSKGPSEAAWIDKGAGWVLGAYSRAQLPPDVIDKVRGIEIVFSAEDPSSLMGKTIDVANRKFFIRD
jgi:hypothetical protein